MAASVDNFAYHYLVNHGRPDIHDLRCFVAVAERLSFTQAAKALCVSLPPLSRRIRDMENALKVRLFIRDTRRVELTRDGARLVPIARHILSLFDELPRIAAERPLGNSVSSVLYGVPPLLHPDVRKKLIDLEVRAVGAVLTPVHLSSSEILTGVRRGELAFGLIRPPLGAPGLRGEAIHEEEMGAVLSRSEHETRRSISVEELSRMPYVKLLGESEAEFGRQFELNLPIVETSRFLTPAANANSSSLIAAGSGFSLAPLTTFNNARGDTSWQEICLPIHGLQAPLVTSLIWRQDLPEADPELYEFVRITRTVLNPYCTQIISN